MAGPTFFGPHPGIVRKGPISIVCPFSRIPLPVAGYGYGGHRQVLSSFFLHFFCVSFRFLSVTSPQWIYFLCCQNLSKLKSQNSLCKTPAMTAVDTFIQLAMPIGSHCLKISCDSSQYNYIRELVSIIRHAWHRVPRRVATMPHPRPHSNSDQRSVSRILLYTFDRRYQRTGRKRASRLPVYQRRHVPEIPRLIQGLSSPSSGGGQV